MKIINKQNNSRMCLVGDLDNQLGLKASFYGLENGELAVTFTPIEQHQSYPGRMHGGISSAILDETSRRVIMIDEPETWGVTVELSVKYNLPVPLEQPLTAIGRITRNNRRFFEGTGEIYLPDGSLAVSAAGKYLKLPIDRIADFDKQSKSGKWYIIKMTLWKSICLIKRKMNQRNPKTPSPLFIMEST